MGAPAWEKSLKGMASALLFPFVTEGVRHIACVRRCLTRPRPPQKIGLYWVLAGFSAVVPASATLLAHGPAAASAEKKVIALTFDDGPKPYVLLGGRSGAGVGSQSLLELLDRQGVKATFFVMGWRLSKNADERCRKVDGGVCREAAQEEHRRGHEIENHTYGHGDFRLMKKRYGEEWILRDIDKGSEVIQSLTGEKPTFLRPPDWDIWPEFAKRLHARGYQVMSKSAAYPPALRDVDSEDYFCAGRDRSRCPRPSDYDYVLRAIEQRERKGIYQHILVFHELPQSVETLSRLIPEVQKRGYSFMLLQKYVAALGKAAL
jgi:peptidoglycan/xylan/chitin deacetylase (PgdA/CDA1 family)